MSINAPARLGALEMYGTELMRVADGPPSGPRLRLVDDSGGELPLAMERYLGHCPAEEDALLDRAVGPVLDVGCGPGRHVLALCRRGIRAVGLDISPLAVRLARRRGADVIEGSVFDAVPHAGAWGSALLLDGNVGIGGDPEQLLARVAELLRPGGLLLVEAERPGAPTGTFRLSLESDFARSEWFPWARLAVDQLDALAPLAGFHTVERWQTSGRWFASLAVMGDGSRGRPPGQRSQAG